MQSKILHIHICDPNYYLLIHLWSILIDRLQMKLMELVVYEAQYMYTEWQLIMYM